MEVNWSTFLLEIVNFLVLVWLLKRFLYRPVQEVIARRQRGIEQCVADAEKIRIDAEQLQQKYTGRLEEWARQQQLAREQLQRELQDERKKLELELQRDLQTQQRQAEVLARRQRREQQLELERQAAEQGGKFAARLLQEGAGPELESRLQAMFLETLGEIAPEELPALRSELARDGVRVEVASAYPLPEAQRGEIRAALQDLAGKPVTANFVEDPELIAGLRLCIGAWVLGCNIREELRGFVQAGQLDAASRER